MVRALRNAAKLGNLSQSPWDFVASVAAAGSWASRKETANSPSVVLMVFT